MKPPPFRYCAPETIDAVLELLAQYGPDARLLAGGQSLLPAMNMRHVAPAVVIDLNRVKDLAWIQGTREDELSIGAMTRQTALERDPAVAMRAPLLAEAVPYIGTTAIRSRGTLGGSLAQSLQGAELPGVCMALGARLRLRTQRRGDRWMSTDEFFLGGGKTALAHDELLTEVILPPQAPRTGAAYHEVMRRNVGVALVGAAAWLVLDQQRRCREARVILVGVDGSPIRSRTVENALLDVQPEPEALAAAAAGVRQDIAPLSDAHGSARLREHLARVLVRRVLSRAAARALETEEGLR